jgi:hypothetical protein
VSASEEILRRPAPSHASVLMFTESRPLPVSLAPQANRSSREAATSQSSPGQTIRSYFGRPVFECGERLKQASINRTAEIFRGFNIAETLGGPGGVRTHDVLSEADYESAACNQHGVRPTKLRSVARTKELQQQGINKKARSTQRPGFSMTGRHTTRKRAGLAIVHATSVHKRLTKLNSLRGKT